MVRERPVRPAWPSCQKDRGLGQTGGGLGHASATPTLTYLKQVLNQSIVLATRHRRVSPFGSSPRLQNNKTTLEVVILFWCAREDLNLHTLRHLPLRQACLPFHHSRIYRYRVQVIIPERTWLPQTGITLRHCHNITGNISSQSFATPSQLGCLRNPGFRPCNPPQAGFTPQTSVSTIPPLAHLPRYFTIFLPKTQFGNQCPSCAAYVVANEPCCIRV